MTTISKEEVIKISIISNIILSEQEIGFVQHELQSVLSYAERVTTIPDDAKDTQLIPLNVFREDNVIDSENSFLLSNAPEIADNYFVVPLIIE